MKRFVFDTYLSCSLKLVIKCIDMEVNVCAKRQRR